jgi:hypothetical protein
VLHVDNLLLHYWNFECITIGSGDNGTTRSFLYYSVIVHTLAMHGKDSLMPKSEVETFREQQALQEQATRNGLYGVAIVANHASIIARMKRAATHLLHLIDEGKHEEVLRLMETPDWG